MSSQIDAYVGGGGSEWASGDTDPDDDFYVPDIGAQIQWCEDNGCLEDDGYDEAGAEVIVEQSTRQAFDMTWGTMPWLQRHRATCCPIQCVRFCAIGVVYS